MQPVPGKEVTLEAVSNFLGERIARLKIPRKLDLQDALPRQESGKIFKQVLRKPYWDDTGRKI
ncbi:MAG: hypothetical protein AAFZ91_02235 [Pseudomonadota bacterium]